MRYARLFDYQHEATTLLSNSDFLSLSDHVTQYDLVWTQTLGLHISDSIKVWLLSGVPRIYDRTDLNLSSNCHVALPSILKRYFCSELTITQFTELLIARQAEDEKMLDTAATACRKMKRAKQILARLPHSTASSTNTGALLAPGSMSNTPPPSPRILDTSRSRTSPPDRLRPIDMPFGPPQSESSSLATPPPSLSPPLRTVYTRFPTGPMKGNPSPQTAMDRSKDPTKGPTGGDLVLALDTPFSPLQNKKAKISLPKGGKKGKNKDKDKGGYKGKSTGKGKNYKG